jgi:hypothetical protein
MRDESFTARENRSQFTKIGRALDRAADQTRAFLKIVHAER